MNIVALSNASWLQVSEKGYLSLLVSPIDKYGKFADVVYVNIIGYYYTVLYSQA